MGLFCSIFLDPLDNTWLNPIGFAFRGHSSFYGSARTRLTTNHGQLTSTWGFRHHSTIA